MTQKHFNGIDTVIWDWNGTLLNDVDICIKSMNLLLRERGLPLLNKQRYLEIFTFPVKIYYRKAGFDFDKEPFEQPAARFMEHYHRFLPEAELFPRAGQVLDQLHRKGYKQIMISAMEHQSLVRLLKERGIDRYFYAVSGIKNIYAHSKTEVARALFRQLKLKPGQCLWIGDTLHDLEVARALGTNHLLVASGHQSAERLLRRTDRVVTELNEVVRKLVIKN